MPEMLDSSVLKTPPTRTEKIFYFVLGFASGIVLPGILVLFFHRLAFLGVSLTATLSIAATVYVVTPFALRKRYPHFAKGFACCTAFFFVCLVVAIALWKFLYFSGSAR